MYEHPLHPKTIHNATDLMVWRRPVRSAWRVFALVCFLAFHAAAAKTPRVPHVDSQAAKGAHSSSFSAATP
jgi:hypothetical protein